MQTLDHQPNPVLKELGTLNRRIDRASLCIAAAVIVAGCSSVAPTGTRSSDDNLVQILRTTDDIPHINAQTWQGLGFGQGFAQAQDALCTLADGFVTASGMRSYYFGPEERPELPSTLGQRRNLDLDVFYRAIVHEQVTGFASAQPVEIQQLVAGYAQGYNHYLNTLETEGTAPKLHRCAGEAWLQPIQPENVYQRMFALNLIAGYGNFIEEIAGAQPPSPSAEASRHLDTPAIQLAQRLQHPIAGTDWLGSNMLAFGEQATGEPGQSVLFSNPHWLWSGIDRFYQVHLTLPGQIDAAGVSFLGVPLLMMGFNHDIAWTHTVSTARRFGLFELLLDPEDPRRYLIDGQSHAMEAVEVQVPVRSVGSKAEAISHTIHRTSLGIALDLSGAHPELGWDEHKVFAIRDINEGNLWSYSNFLAWSQATSLDDFVAIQQRHAGMPWVNTAAIGKHDGRVWYADIGQIPNVPDALRAQCQTPLGQAFAQLDPAVPVLDGSRSQCNWQSDTTAAQSGAMAAKDLPALWRTDYVANMNDSYWLVQPRQVLEGFPGNLGGERQAPSLRTLEGLRIAESVLELGFSRAENLATHLEDAVLESRAYSADRWKFQLLQRACVPEALQNAIDSYQLEQENEAKETGRQPPERLTIGQLELACSTLARWSNMARPQDAGVLLWDSFWRQLHQLEEPLFGDAFSSAAPLKTPGEIDVTGPAAAQALARSVGEMEINGVEISAPLARQRKLETSNETIRFFGGCADTGYFTITCTFPDDQAVNALSGGNTYLQIAYFDEQGDIQARTLLAHGQDEAALTEGEGLAPVHRYTQGRWLRFPFTQADIAADAKLTQTVIRYSVEQ